jgi:hypothetical protein
VPADPVPVFLVDFGYSSSLVLPAGEGTLVAYTYGDWRYYALRQRGVYESAAALLWPTRGTLGRAVITGPPDAETVRRGIGAGTEHVHALIVDRAAADALRRSLDEIHRAALGTAVVSYGMTFVHHPSSYTYWSNSNRMTARWLAELGCDVRGPALGSHWRVHAAELPAHRVAATHDAPPVTMRTPGEASRAGRAVARSFSARWSVVPGP